MTSLAAPKVALKLTPVPKTVLYAGLAGELLKNTGMKDDDQIRRIQQAVSEGLVAKVIVVAKDSQGRVDKLTLAMAPFSASDQVSIAMESGKSYLEAVDVSLAAQVQHAATMIQRRGLTPQFYVDWSSRAKASPAIIADAVRRLNLKVDPDAERQAQPQPAYAEPSYPAVIDAPVRYPQTVRTYVASPPLPPGYVYVPVVTIAPEKDPGLSFSWETSRKR